MNPHGICLTTGFFPFQSGNTFIKLWAEPPHTEEQFCELYSLQGFPGSTNIYDLSFLKRHTNQSRNCVVTEHHQAISFV